MTLHIGLDARGANTNFVRGMGEYISSLVRTISPGHDVSWSLYGNRPDLPFHRPPGGEIRNVSLHDIPGARFHSWEQFVLPAEAALQRVDVLHCTSTTLPLWQPVPTVVTIHDTLPWDNDEMLPDGFFRNRVLPLAYARCQKIITISHHSRNDIVRIWPHLSDKIRVIHHGIKAEFLDCAPAPLPPHVAALGLTRPYLVYFGGTAPRKRLDWTIELYRALGRTDVLLAICGVAEAQHEAYRRQLHPALRNQVIFLPFIAAPDMPLLYQNALAVLYPTLYEGFGLPAVNAQAVGAPILMSSVSSLLELIGPTSIVLDPNDDAAWAEACRSVIDRRIAAPAPDEATRTWAKQFDWKHSAQAHWEVYQEATRKR